jgi:ComF family protein
LRTLAPALAELLFAYLEENPLPADVLVPVPLHHRRLRERGYNQSALLAGRLGRLSDLPVVVNGLARHRYTSPQARSADIGERHMNVADSFSCRDLRFQGKRVLLVDDVSTSGATLNACAAVLKASGAVSVWGLVLALEL